MRVGLIGYGAWGRHHARALAVAPSAALVAIAARGDANAAAAAIDWPGIAVHRNWRDVVADPSLEAIVIAVPNALHAEVALTALAAGKHVLQEKPMALTLADCDRLIAAARSAGRVLTIGHELRVSRQWAPVRDLIAQGAIGTLRHAAFSLFRFPYRQGSSAWRYDPTAVGSWILEEPVHLFDLLLWYGKELGPPRTLRAVAEGDPAMPNALSVMLHFDGGAFATLNTVVGGFEHHVALHAMGTGGAIRALWSAAMDRSGEASASLHLMRGRAAPGQVAESITFERSGEIFELETQAEQAIRGFRDGRALVPAEQARAAIACCLLAERSARENGREIFWTEADPSD
ncbi:Gfo/Idh/MocA family oxidoreductase [Roseomonas sp. CAU 1739]|uniref:Gfo/Idh/MocA family protein n=1 Tax=Roseomonas sp. CAU 1739 TaxID=3140364 RepID=UPI00325BCFB8